MENVKGFLDYGFMGLSLALAVLAYGLLRAEQGNKDSPAARLRLIRLFLMGIPVLAVIAGVFRYIEMKVVPPREAWRIEGRVVKEDADDHSQIGVQQLPPKPSTTTLDTGWFLMERVEVETPGELPKLYFEAAGYFPDDIDIDETTADVDREMHRIKLRQIELVKKPEGMDP